MLYAATRAATTKATCTARIARLRGLLISPLRCVVQDEERAT